MAENNTPSKYHMFWENVWKNCVEEAFFKWLQMDSNPQPLSS